MKNLRSLFEPTLRNRLLVLTVALVVTIAGSVLLIVRLEVRKVTDARLQQDFANTYRTFKRFLSLRNERLIESCLLISELPVLKAQLSTRDPATLRDYVLSRDESPAKLVAVDIFTLTDEKGRVLFRLDRPDQYGDTLTVPSFIGNALQGKDPKPDDITFWTIDDRLYQIVTVPIFQRFLIGTLTLGKRITEEEAQSLKEGTQSDITFLLGTRIIASTHPDIAQADLLRSYLVHRAEIDEKIRNGGSIQEQVQLNGENFLCAFTRASLESDAVYVMALSVDHALAPFTRIENVTLLVSILAFLVAIIAAYLLAERITAPIRTLVRGTEQIRAGNYEFHLPSTSRDEIGQLARSFNDMVLGLKERFLMSKFMSSMAVQMIRQEGGKVRLGGERTNVTVLFSDIRGFTAYSETVEPERVIELLNRYLSRQAAIVTKHNGVVDKFVGDEIIAIFVGENMVDDAVLCAIEIQKELTELNRAHDEEIRVGIGINTGMAVVGNIGSEERMDHTVLGSNMNLGARLSDIARPGQIVISESSSRLLRSKEVHVRPLDMITVKGIARPVQTYEVVT